MLDWKEGLSRVELYDAMMELLYRDLDSWFNAGTFYCDSCVDNLNWKIPQQNGQTSFHSYPFPHTGA